MEFSINDLMPDVAFKTSRSGGKGGQNVNKVSSKVELNYNFLSSALFNSEQKKRLEQKLANRMTFEGLIQIISEEERSQYLNKERTLQKLYLLVKNALHIQKLRKATRPNKTAVEKRLKNKKLKAIKKLSRRHGDIDL